MVDFKTIEQIAPPFQFSSYDSVNIQPNDLNSPFSIVKIFLKSKFDKNIEIFTSKYANVITDDPEIQVQMDAALLLVYST